MFNYLSKNNPFHVYSINGNKIIRDDYKMSFEHPDVIKCEYYKMPELSIEEANAIILSLKKTKDERFRDMILAIYFDYNAWGKKKYINNITDGDFSKKVKDLLIKIFAKYNELHL